jgi:hypothetical protein
MRKRVHASQNVRRAADLWAGLRETREILDDPEFMAQLRQGIEEAAEGKLIAWEEVERELEATERRTPFSSH